MFVAKLCGLLTILAIPSILRVLMLTGQSGEPVAAFRRYVATITHMLDWYEGDLLEPTSRYDISRVTVQHFSLAQNNLFIMEYQGTLSIYFSIHFYLTKIILYLIRFAVQEWL
jgi:hypothetical protein